MYACICVSCRAHTAERKDSFAVTQPDWRTSYWPANVNTRISTPLVPLHHRVEISLPIHVSPPLALATAVPTLPPSHLASPIHRRCAASRISFTPLRSATIPSCSLPTPRRPFAEPENPARSIPQRARGSPPCALCTNNSRHTHASSTWRQCRAQFSSEKEGKNPFRTITITKIKKLTPSTALPP